MHVVEQSEYPIYEGCHEATISESDWHLAQPYVEHTAGENISRKYLSASGCL